MFEFLIIIEPLGFLYGSAGRSIEDENFVSLSNRKFPPSAATISGIYAANLETELITSLQIAGPFWAYTEEPQNFYVPLPFNYLVENGEIKDIFYWDFQTQAWQLETGDLLTDELIKTEQWLPISSWYNPKEIHQNPWKYIPHLHPRFSLEQRHLDGDSSQENLFLENAVQIDPDTCLIYLSNIPLNDGCYRLGGEGHIVDIHCLEIANSTQELFNEPVGKQFAIITPAVWGSTRLSYIQPMIYKDHEFQPVWEIEAILTKKPQPFRYRLGGTGNTKRLSRGRYAVSSGSVYVLKKAIKQPWYKWSKQWFPTEGYNFKRWGCSLALPLKPVNFLIRMSSSLQPFFYR
jgi:CRISPR-associated protein Cmr3